MKLPLIEVEWLDARSVYEQLPLSKARSKGLSHRVTVGYLVRDDADAVTIAQTFDPAEPDDEEDAVADITVIHPTWIKHRRRLRTAKEKPRGT